MQEEGCVFCGIVKRNIDAQVVFEDDDIMAFNDIQPQAPVHVVIIPKHHIDRLSSVKDEGVKMLGRLVMTAGRIAREMKVEGSGYRVVINCNKDGGQAVFH